MKCYEIKRSQDIPFPIEKVFAFFQDPCNLGTITPQNLKFEMLTPLPVKMHSGVVIDYVIRVSGFPIRWTSVIHSYFPPFEFIDVQLKGPYAFWHHRHTFEETDSGTRMRDHVKYALTFGAIGRVIHATKVRKDLERIFDFRAQALVENISKKNY